MEKRIFLIRWLGIILGIIIYTPIAGGENRIAKLYIMKLNTNFGQIRETEKKLIEVFSNRIYTAITNSLVYTQSKTQAFTDSVTGLYNHRFLQESIKVELENSARGNVPLSLVMLDIDSFKQFNDSYGHSVGDLVLKSVAKMIKEAVNDRGIAARYSGDEFVIVLPGMANAENKESRLVIQTIEAIIAAIDAKDHYTRNHSKSVSSYSIVLARKMGLPVEVVEKVRVGSLLHDVGKIGISDAILKKPAKLTPEEYEIAKQHSPGVQEQKRYSERGASKNDKSR